VNVISYDPYFDDPSVVTASNLRKDSTEERGRAGMDEWQAPQCRPGEKAVKSNGHRAYSASN